VQVVDIEAVSGIHSAAELGEGPLWDPVRSVVWWVDILGGDIYCYDPATQSDRVWHTGRMVSAMATRADGSLLIAWQDGLGSFDPASGGIDLLLGVEENTPTNRFNDGKVDPAGRFWAGTMELDGAHGEGTLYRVDPDLRCTPMIEHVSISNGLGWSLDERLMYYVDTPTRRIDVFDFDPESGTVENRRGFVRIPESDGTPDGLTVDADGHVWVALFGGWSVHRYAPDGTLSGRIDLPVSNITSCTFGGEGLADLFITTATSGLTEKDLKEQPFAGALFRVRPGVVGRPTNNFGG
jgi:sugar lactone lactonase YvrE